MGNEELERLSIEHIRIYESFEKKEKCTLCRSIEEFENQILNSISTDLVMDLDFFPKFGDEYTFCDYHMSKMEEFSVRANKNEELIEINTDKKNFLFIRDNIKGNDLAFSMSKVIKDIKCQEN